MELTLEMKTCLDQSVLCWVATSDSDGRPNVSPKEVFTSDGDRILIAHIASPRTVRNIEVNPQVMVSVVDVFAQHGWQFSGQAHIASPKTVHNLSVNPQAMVSVVDVFDQVGWQFSGTASLVWANSSEFADLVRPLDAITQGLYPIKAVMVVVVREGRGIVAPSSWLFPDQPSDIVRRQVLSRYGVRDP